MFWATTPIIPWGWRAQDCWRLLQTLFQFPLFCSCSGTGSSVTCYVHASKTFWTNTFKISVWEGLFIVWSHALKYSRHQLLLTKVFYSTGITRPWFIKEGSNGESRKQNSVLCHCQDRRCGMLRDKSKPLEMINLIWLSSSEVKSLFYEYNGKHL